MKNLIVVFCLLVFCCSGCKYFKKSTPKSVDIVTADTDSVEQKYDSSAYYGVGDAGTTTVPEPVQTTANAVAGNYYMIVGCFTVQSNADRYIEKIRGMGYDAQIIPGANNFSMVAARTYNSYRESVAELDKFRSDVTPNAWVYRQR
jgi:hypothetical protein